MQPIVIVSVNQETNEFGVPSGFVTVNFLLTSGGVTWLWSVPHLDAGLSRAQIQAMLEAGFAGYLAAIQANNETPLTPDQIEQYQSIIDAANAQTNIDILQANNLQFKLSGTVIGDPNVQEGQGYKDVFKPTGTYTNMANATKFAVLGTVVFAMLDAIIELNKAAILLLRIAKRRAEMGVSRAQSQ